MNLQLIEIYAQRDFLDIEEIKEDFPVIAHWISEELKERKLTWILLETNDVEQILNYLEDLSGGRDAYQIMLLPVKTYLPREKEDQKNEEKDLQRASRHELYTAVENSSRMSISYIWFIVFSSVVATVGIIKNSPAIVIGPVTAVSFASVLGDFRLIRHSLLTSLFGIGIPILIATTFSLFFYPPIYSDEFLSRTDIQIIDVVAALASGAAGAHSFVKRNEGALVGVMSYGISCFAAACCRTRYDYWHG
ncbi:DUF389 domain-containing protein [Virgibacillus profundi]|uniref:DUF389 domain-containing protein n=1 Tax=Virgibacillus profundi TaxID=2024555 RepID=UPI001F0A1485|nr:DUF389 domain-containing protein [Virgibacillus profundi]